MSHREPGFDPFDWIDDEFVQIDRQHLRRKLRDRQSQPAAEITIDGRWLINFSSNDYLGLARDPRLIEAAHAAAVQFGWGSGASPLITGHSQLHRELELAIARFEHTEAALLFPTGYAANVGAITALSNSRSAIFSDAKNHASIIDGCRLAGAAGAQIEVYPHGDVKQLADRLAAHASAKRKLIVTDSLFSMDGDVAPLPELLRLAEQHGAMLLVDEAHATGVLGQTGRGACELLGAESSAILRIGTLSKALGSLGGFAAGSQRIVDWITNRGRTLIFSTATPPAVCAAALAALEIVDAEPERRQKVLELAESLRQRLVQTGHNVGTSTSQIIPVILGDPVNTMQTSARLQEAGILVPGIRPPSVPAGESLLRISLSYDHTPEMVDRLLDALAVQRHFDAR